MRQSETRNAGVLYLHHVAHRHRLPHPRLSAAVPGLRQLRLRQLPRARATRCRRPARTRRSCSSCSASASRRASCRCTSGCRRRIRSRPATSPRCMSGVLIKTGIYGLTRVLLRFSGHAAELVGRDGADHRHDFRRAGRALRADGARSEAAAGLSQHREHRHHPDGLGRGADVPAHRPSGAGDAGADRRAVSHHQPRRRSRRCSSSARARCCTPRTRATWRRWAG